MMKQPYRVGEGANLAIFPHGTKVGDVVMLTEAEALYERDMGRIVPVEAAPVPGETKGYPIDAATGVLLPLTAEERARIQAGPDLGVGPEEAVLGEMLPEAIPEQDRLPPADGTEKTAEADGVEKTAVEPKAGRGR